MIRKLSVISLLLTIAWLSSCMEEPYGVNSPVKVEDTAPDFSLEKVAGGWISLSDYKDKNNVVLIFHQGST